MSCPAWLVRPVCAEPSSSSRRGVRVGRPHGEVPASPLEAARDEFTQILGAASARLAQQHAGSAYVHLAAVAS
jgi:hypothetical protein